MIFVLVSLLLLQYSNAVSSGRQEIRNTRETQNDLIDAILSRVASDSSNSFETKGVEVVCLRRNMCIAISSRFYELENLSPINWDSLKFNGECPDAIISDNVPGARTLCTRNGFMTCGSTMSLNDTHVIFKNELRAREIDDNAYPEVVIGHYNDHVLPWDCTYPLDYLVSLSSKNQEPNFHYLPFASEIRQIIVNLGTSASGYGTFHAGMFLYPDDRFEKIMSIPPVYNMTDIMYIGLTLLDAPLESVIQVRSCWGTPTNESSNQRRFYLIENFCPNASFVKYYDNKMERHFRWSSYVFRFINSSNVYLHCEVEVCFYQYQFCDEKNKCSIPPSNRKKRSAATTNKQILSIGPLRLSEDVMLVNEASLDLMETTVVEEYTNDWAWIIFFAVSLSGIAGLLLILVLLLYQKACTGSR